MKNKLLVIFGALFLLTACETGYTPKPHAYFRIDFPRKSYTAFNQDCPFTFEQPVYAVFERDLSPNAEPCWLNMNFVPYNATLHLTYKPIGGDFKLEDLQNDSRRFVMNHSIKAQEIIEEIIFKPVDNVHGVLYRLTGNTATALQFYVTDSSSHYLRGALYFNSNTNADSIAPVLSYLAADVGRLINTLKWKK